MGKANRLFVLGGNDLEMEVVRSLLTLAGEKWVQPNKGWGSHVYAAAGDLGLTVEEILVQTGPDFWQHNRKSTRCAGIECVIFVECSPTKEWPEQTEVVVVDHHGDQSHRPPAVQQVLALIKMPTSEQTRRWIELVGANDAGYVPAMRALGASDAEVERIRALDRAAQGVTPAHETEALRAIGAKEVDGRLTVVRMDHSKTSAVADRLYGAVDQLLILSKDGEVNFYGDGALCASLKEHLGGWSGGAGLGKAGQPAYWGASGIDGEVVLAAVKKGLAS